MTETLDLFTYFGDMHWTTWLALILFFVFGAVSNGDDDESESDNPERVGKLLARAVRSYRKKLRRDTSVSTSQKVEESADSNPLFHATGNEEFHDRDNEDNNPIWQSDSELFEDESVPIDEKIARFRERLNESDESARLPLAKSLIVAARYNVKRNETASFQMSDEAQKLLDEEESPQDEDFVIAQIEVATYRVLFHLSLYREPPFELVRDLQDKIRQVEVPVNSLDFRVCLMHAWFAHAQALLTLGASSSSLTSFENAFKIVDDMKDDLGEEAKTFPDVPFLLTSYGRACETAGDVETAIKSYRTAASLFCSFRTVPLLLSKASNVNSLLVNLLTTVGRIADAKTAAIGFRRRIEDIWRKNRKKTFLTYVHALLGEANFYSKAGDFSNAIQTLTKTEQTILRGAQALRKVKSHKYASSIRRMLVDVYSMRASLYYVQRDFASAWKDIVNGLRYFNKALTKDERLPLEQIFICFFALAFNVAAVDEKWDVFERYEKFFKRFLSLVPPKILPSIANSVSDSARKLHRVNQLGEETKRAGEWIEVAIDSMASAVAADGGNSPRICLTFAENLMLRCVFRLVVQNDVEGVFADLQQIDELYRETELSTLIGMDYEATGCYFEFLRRFACMTWSHGDHDKAIALIKKFFRTLNRAFRCGNTTILRELKEFVPIVLHFAAEAGSPLTCFRLFCFLSHYIGRIRAKILKIDVGIEVRRQIECDFVAANTILYDSRIRFLESLQWDDRFNSFIPKKSAELVHDAFCATYLDNAKRIEKTTEPLGCPSFEEFVNARREFVFEKLIKYPRDFILWHDLQMCSRLITCQMLEEGIYSDVKLLSDVFCKLNDLYWRHGEAQLAFTELCYTKDVIDAVVAKKSPALASLVQNEDASPSHSAPSDGGEKNANVILGIQKLLNAKVESVQDAIFWNATFAVALTFLIAFERFVFGKESSLASKDSRLIESPEELGNLIWFKRSSEGVHDDSTEDEKENVGESTVSQVSIEDYLRADKFQKLFFDRIIHISRLLGRNAVLHESWGYEQYKKLLHLLFEWRFAWREVDELKSEVNDELDSLESGAGENMGAQTTTLHCCYTLTDYAIDVLKDREFAIELHERLLDISHQRFILAACFAALRFGFSFADFFPKLARMANLDGNEVEELVFLFRALDEYSESGMSYEHHLGCFMKTANMLSAFFFHKDSIDIRLARGFSLRFEEAFDSVWTEIKEHSEVNNVRSVELLQASWRCFTVIGVYFADKRRCFYSANKLFDKSWFILQTLLHEVDDPTISLFYSPFLAFSASFKFDNGLIERAVEEERYVATVGRLFQRESLDKKLDSFSQDDQVQSVVFQMDIARLSNSVFYGTEPLSPKACSGLREYLQSRPEYADFERQKRYDARVTLPFIEKHIGKSSQISSKSLEVGGKLFIVNELEDFTKVDEIGFDGVKRSIKTLRTNLRKTCLRHSVYELEFEYNWIRFACLKQEWTDACRNARRILKRFYSSENAVSSEVEQSRFQRIHIELLKIETFCLLRSGRRRDAVRVQTGLDKAFDLFIKLFNERYFEIRTLYVELLTLKALRLHILGRSSEALQEAERAQRLFDRFEARGFSNWLPEIRSSAASVIATLRSKTEERSTRLE